MKSENTVPIEYLILRYCIKYQRLSELISISFKGSQANVVNLYIDLYGLYTTIFSRSYRTDISNYTSFTSTLINVCAHYRRFFKSYGVYCNIWIVSSYNVPEINRKFVAGYNKIMVDKLAVESVKEMVELNSQLLDILCPYLPNIYFVHTEFESSILIGHIIQKEINNGNTNPNIILSGDLYPLQLCSEFDNTVFLRPIKYYHNNLLEDKSVISIPRNAENAKEMFWSIVCGKREKLTSDKNALSISPRNYMLLEACNRFPERNLPCVMTINYANRLIYELVQDNDIKANVDMIYDAHPELLAKVQKSIIDSRFKALDYEYQSFLFNESLEPKLLHYENLNDSAALQLINSKYFANDPIDLFSL